MFPVGFTKQKVHGMKWNIYEMERREGVREGWRKGVGRREDGEIMSESKKWRQGEQQVKGSQEGRGREGRKGGESKDVYNIDKDSFQEINISK